MKKIYIAGKVSGEPIAECTMKFGLAQKQIEDKGYIAINPLELVNDWKMDWKPAMKICITALFDCDAVLFLEDYTKSKGALIEFGLAKSLGLDRYFSTTQIPT